MFLTQAELIVLTGRHRAGWQVRQLEHLGIPYRRRTDGSLIVLRAHVEHLQDVQPRPRLRLPA